VYLTDGVFLYRVVGPGRSDAGESVELEDRYLLDVVRVSKADLRARGLRVVMPARNIERGQDRLRWPAGTT